MESKNGIWSLALDVAKCITFKLTSGLRIYNISSETALLVWDKTKVGSQKIFVFYVIFLKICVMLV